MNCYQPTISAQRREAIRRAAQAVVRLQTDPEARATARRHNLIVNDPELYGDGEAREAMHALEVMVHRRGLMAEEGDPEDYPCDQCGAEPGERCKPWCIGRQDEKRPTPGGAEPEQRTAPAPTRGTGDGINTAHRGPTRSTPRSIREGEDTLAGYPARHGKLSQDARADIVASYEAGEAVASIATRHGVAVAAVYYHLNRRTILRRDRGPAHGTPRGYQWHRRHGQDPCGPCREARAASEAEYARARKEGTETTPSQH